MDDTLTTQQYAEQQGVSRRTVQRWIQQGLIFAVKIGRQFLIPFDEQPPTFYQEQDRINSQVQPVPAILTPDNAGLPVPIPEPRFAPEVPFFADDDELDDFEEECEDADAFSRKDLRQAYSTREEAEAYAGDIPVATRVFKRCSDGFYQVAVEY
jgi:excisionase family DNA binding protein